MHPFATITSCLLVSCALVACIEPPTDETSSALSTSKPLFGPPLMATYCVRYPTDCLIHGEVNWNSVRFRMIAQDGRFLAAAQTDALLIDDDNTNNAEWYIEEEAAGLRIHSEAYGTCLRRTSATHVEVGNCGPEGDLWTLVERTSPSLRPLRFGVYRLKNVANGRCLASNNNLVPCADAWQYELRW